MYTINSPLRVLVTKKKLWTLNLGLYRNTEKFTLNNAKIQYGKDILNQLMLLPQFDRITIEYVVYPKSLVLFDLDNVTSIHAKFFQDCLKNLGLIKDDNYKFIIGSNNRFGAVDKLNPRVEIIITEIKE
jgi:hypothetical protein